MQVPKKTLDALPSSPFAVEIANVHILPEFPTKILLTLRDPDSGREWTWEAHTGKLDEIFQA